MLNGTELLISVVFVILLSLLSIIDVAFSSVSKISLRRMLDGPKVKLVNELTALLETRSEILVSIQVSVQLLLVSGAVFLFAAFGRRGIPYLEGMSGTILLMFAIILVFRQLLPRLIVARNPEVVLIQLF